MTDNTDLEIPWTTWGLLAALPILFTAVLIDLPSRWGGFRGDSAVYVAMASSLAYDQDLQYTRDDLIRISQEWPQGPQGILLVADSADANRLFYAKQPVYSLLTAPFFRLMKTNGMLFFNALCYLLILWSGFTMFESDPVTRRNAVIWTWIFYGLSVVPAYIFIPTPDLFNGALLAAGLLTWVRADLNPSGRKYCHLNIASSVILAIAAAARPPNALFLWLPISSLVVKLWHALRSGENRERNRLLISILISFLTIAATALALLSINYLLTGQVFSYSGFRKRIVGHLPFESETYTFLNTGNEISTRSTRFVFHWSTVFWNILYFFTGRFAGLIPYMFPAVIALILPLFARSQGGRSNVRWQALLVVILLILFHIVYIPSNYNGGSCAIGNRYLISFLPGFFIVSRRLPQPRTMIAVAGITALLTAPIALNPVDAFARYAEVGKRPAYDIFPPEITLLNSWPVDDQIHTRVPFEGYFIYFADDDQYGKELDGFWTKGSAEAVFVLRCWSPVETIRFKIRNGGVRNRISGMAGKEKFSGLLEAGETREFVVDPGKPVLSYNLEGNPSYCYTTRISTTDGFIPRFVEPGSGDSRYLGCFVQISLNS